MPEELNSKSMIVAKGLKKVYGDFVAVDGIDFEVKQGEAFGLLGPNGAGKSTTMRMIASTSMRSGGQLEILGKDPNKHGPEIRFSTFVNAVEFSDKTKRASWDKRSRNEGVDSKTHLFGVRYCEDEFKFKF